MVCVAATVRFVVIKKIILYFSVRAYMNFEPTENTNLCHNLVIFTAREETHLAADYKQLE